MLNNLLNKYNKRSLFNYDKEIDRDYCKLVDLVECNGIEAVYTLEAIFINSKSKFGEAPILVTSQWLVNAPSHLINTVKQMMDDTEIVEMINQRKVGFKIYSYVDSNSVIRFSVEWVEVS